MLRGLPSARSTRPWSTTLRDAGMVTLGKPNCDEFAMGSSNENSPSAPVHNPWDHAARAGRLSGGSAAAVAARLAPAATGTDTGGSIRQPASFSRHHRHQADLRPRLALGMIAFASSLDQAGPMAQSAEDCALLFNAMVGFDPRDSTSAGAPARRTTRARSTCRVKGLRIGVPKEFFGDGPATRCRRRRARGARASTKSLARGW